YKNTKEVFTEILKVNQQIDEGGLREGMKNDASAIDLLESFLEMEKETILRENLSLTTAVYEFYFNHQHHLEENWLQNQFNNAEKTLGSLIQYGIDQCEFRRVDSIAIARNILFILEGLRVSAEVIEVDEEMI